MYLLKRKKRQHLFLAMAVSVKRMIKNIQKNEKNCFCAERINQKKLIEMKTQGIALLVPCTPCFSVLISNHLACVLQQCLLMYSEPYKTCKMDILVENL